MAKSSRRKRAAWGTLTMVGPSTWRLRYWAEGADGYKRRSKTIRNATRRDAEKVRAELMLAHSDDAPCPTVGEAWEQWALPDMERMVEGGDLAPETRKAYVSTWHSCVAPRWAGVPCDEVRPLHVQQWLTGLGYTQAQKGRGLMSRVLAYAVRYELLDHNPMREDYVMPSKSTVARRDKGVWGLSELPALWRKVHGSWWEAAFLLAAYGGCRVGESLAPLGSDVTRMDVDGVPLALVRVAGQVAPRGTKVVPPKTAWSVRTAVLAGVPALRLLAIADALPDPSWPLTGDGLGGHASQQRLATAWASTGAGHPYRNLRNGWQTWMRWDMGVAPHHIEAMMGHRLPGVTGAHYDRPVAEQMARVLADAYRAHPYDVGCDFAMDG